MNAKKFFLYGLLDGLCLLSFVNGQLEVERTFDNMNQFNVYLRKHTGIRYEYEKRGVTCDHLEMEVAKYNCEM